MTPENFCYWLQGYFEISNTVNLSQEQIVMIRKHLALVFTKVTGERREGSSGFSGFCGIVKSSSGSGYSGYCGLSPYDSSLFPQTTYCKPLDLAGVGVPPLFHNGAMALHSC